MDTMTLTYSVQDQTIQIARIRGILALVRSIPGLDKWFERDTSNGGNALWNVRWEAVGRDVIQCSVEAAHNYSLTLKDVFDKNEERLNNFTASNPASEVTKKNQRIKLLLAAREREKKDKEAQEKAERDEEDLRVKEERYRQLREKEMERLETEENQGGLDRDEQEQRQRDLDESDILEKELIAKSERYRTLFYKQLERLEKEEALRESEERKRKSEKFTGTDEMGNEPIGNDQPVGALTKEVGTRNPSEVMAKSSKQGVGALTEEVDGLNPSEMSTKGGKMISGEGFEQENLH